MAQYHFDLTFDFRNPGDLITSDMSFVGASNVQGYAFGHQLYDEKGQPVPFDPPHKKSHRFVAGDTVFMRLFAVNALDDEAMAPQTLHFDLTRLNAEGDPLISAQAGQTPFATTSGAISGQKLGLRSTRYSLTWNLAQSQTLVPTSGGNALPCWVLQRYPEKELSPWIHTAPNDTGAPATFSTLPDKFDDGKSFEQRWRFQLWTKIGDNTGANKIFIFDPEMIIDPKI